MEGMNDERHEPDRQRRRSWTETKMQARKVCMSIYGDTHAIKQVDVDIQPTRP